MPSDKTVTEHLYEHFYTFGVGLALKGPRWNSMPDLAELQETRWSPLFEQLMRRRLITGAFRHGYERLRDFEAKVFDFDYPNDIVRRVRLYQETGNLETLVDIANLALIEFLVSKHPKKHFRATDDGEHAQTKGS